MLRFAGGRIRFGVDHQDISIGSIGDPEFISIEHVVITCKRERESVGAALLGTSEVQE